VSGLGEWVGWVSEWAGCAADINHELLRMAEDEELMQVCSREWLEWG
jgi:hypothetical protein